MTPFSYEYGSYQTFDPTATLLDGNGCEVILELPPIYVINNGLNALFDSLIHLKDQWEQHSRLQINLRSPLHQLIHGHGIYQTDTIINFTDASIANEFGPPGTYQITLVVADTNGCFHDYTLDVIVTNEFHLPNVFTPNGDGVNEVFEMKADVFESFRNRDHEPMGECRSQQNRCDRNIFMGRSHTEVASALLMAFISTD